MSLLDTLKSDVQKVGSFIVSQIVAAENLLGAKTGNAKLNVVVGAAEAALKAMGVDVTSVSAELTAVVNALVALFNKTGVLPK